RMRRLDVDVPPEVEEQLVHHGLVSIDREGGVNLAEVSVVGKSRRPLHLGSRASARRECVRAAAGWSGGRGPCSYVENLHQIEQPCSRHRKFRPTTIAAWWARV